MTSCSTILSASTNSGPVNGDFGTKTQAALAQFQLANNIPVSGMLDSATLAALDVPLVDQAMTPSAGAPAEPEGSRGGQASAGDSAAR